MAALERGRRRAFPTTRARGSWPRRRLPSPSTPGGAEKMLERKREQLGRWRPRSQAAESAAPDLEAALDDDVGDDLLRPRLRLVPPGARPPEARSRSRCASLGGLTTAEVARAFLVLGAHDCAADRPRQADAGRRERVPSRSLGGAERASRLLVGARGASISCSTRGYSATAGDDPDATRSLRGCPPPRTHPRRACADGAGGSWPRRPHGGASVAAWGRGSDAAGEPILLPDQDRGRWDQPPDPPRSRRARSRRSARRRPGALRAPGCDRRVPRPRADAGGDLDWARMASLYGRFADLTRSPVVELNRAVAVSMAFGPAAGLELVDALVSDPALASYHLLPGGPRRPPRQAGAPRRGAARSSLRAASAHPERRASGRCSSAGVERRARSEGRAHGTISRTALFTTSISTRSDATHSSPSICAAWATSSAAA